MSMNVRLTGLVFGLTVCATIACLWMRSYRTSDYIQMSLWTGQAFAMTTREGQIAFTTWTSDTDAQWFFQSRPLTELPEMRPRGGIMGCEIVVRPDGNGIGIILPFWLLLTLSDTMFFWLPHIRRL